NGVSFVDHLSHELSVHQEELEMQNRELREMAHELEDSRNRYANLYDFAPVGYVSLNVRGEIQEINLTAAQMIGKERTHLMDRPIHLFMDERLRFLSFLQDVMMSGN